MSASFSVRLKAWAVAAAALAGLTGLAVLPSSVHAQQRSIINTSFEQNDPAGPGAPSYAILPASSVPGWQSTTGFIELWDSGFNGVPAHAGAVFAEMNANEPGALYQNVCFTKGETLGWSFAHRARSGGAATQVANFEIASSTGVVLQLLASQATTVPQGWQVNNGTGVYNGPTGVQRIQFRTTNPGSIGNFLDAIQIDLAAYGGFRPAATSSVEGASTPTIPTVVVNGKVDQTVTIPVTVVGGTATAGVDFTMTAGVVTIPPGNYDGQAFPIPLVILNDSLIESSETIIFQLGAPSNTEIMLADLDCTGAPPTIRATHTIIDDDVDLRTVKTLASSTATPAEGEAVSFRIAVTNVGPQGATGVNLTDQLPAGFNFVSATPSIGTYNSATGLWTIGALANGATANLILTGTVAVGQNGATLTNTTTAATGVNVDVTRTAGDDLTESVTINSASALAMVKTGTLNLGPDNAAGVGDVITYAFTVRNTGNAALTNVTLTDPLPGIVVSGGPIATLPRGGVDTTTFTATYALTQADLDRGRVDNIATASGANPSGGAVTANGAWSVSIPQTFGLSVIKTQSGGPVTVTAAGQVLTYAIVVRNLGNTTQTNVSVVDTLPNGTVSPLAAPTESVAADGLLQPGETWTYSVNYTVSQADVDGGGPVVNAVVAQSDQSPPVSDDAATPVSGNPALIVTKSVDRSTISAPGVLNYVITISNGGNVSLTGVQVADTLPNGAAATLSGPAGDGGVPNVIDVGETWTYTTSYAVDQAQIDAGVARINRVSATAAQVTTPATASATTTISQAPAMSIVKDVDRAFISQPGVLNYVIRVANTGNVALTGVVVSDTLPDGALITLTAPSGDAGVVGVLDVGETWTYATTFSVSQSRIDAGTALVNTASAISTQTPNPVSDPATTTVSRAAAFTTLKTVDLATVTAPGPLTYTITLTNTGNVSLTSVTPVDTLPNGGVGVLSAPVESLPGGTVGVLDVGEVWTYTLVYNVTQAEIEAGLALTNTVEVTTAEVPSPQDSVTTTVARFYSLSVDKIVDQTTVSVAGTVLNYTVTLRNTGNAALTGLTLVDTLPDGSAGVLTYTGGDTDGDNALDVNEVWTYSGAYTVTQPDIDAGQQLVNRVRASATERPGFVEDEATTSVAQNPEILIEKDVDRDTISTTALLNYTIVVTNTGNVALTNVVLTDTLPNGVGGVLAGPSGDGGVAGTLEVGEAWTYTTTYQTTQAELDAGADLTNTVSVTATDPGGNVTDSDSAVTALVRVPGMLVKKSVDQTTISAPGTLNYVISVSNTGNVALTGVMPTDTLPDGTVGALTGPNGDADGDNELDVGETWTYAATYAVDQTMIDAGVALTNVVAVLSDQTPSQQASAVTNISGAPGLIVTKTVDQSVISAPGTLNYVIRVRNTGNVSLTGVTPVDTLPNGTIATLTGPSGDTDSDGVLDVGETWAYGATYAVDQAQIDARTPLTNSVTVQTAQTGPQTATAVTTIEAAPSLRIVKTVDRASVSTPTRLSYAIIVTNTGNQSLGSVVLNDTLSNGGVVTVGPPVESLAGGVTGVLEVGESWTYLAIYDLTQADIDAGADLINTAAVVTDQTAVQQDTATTTINGIGQIRVDKSVDLARVNTPTTLNYVIRVTNTGNQSLNTVVLTDTLSNGAAVTVGAPVESLAGGVAGVLEVGETWIYAATYDVTVADIDAGLALTNTAGVTARRPSGAGVSGSDDATTAVDQRSSLILTKTATLNDGGDGRADVGDTLTYGFAVRNTGNVTLSNVTVTDTLAGLTLSGGPIASLAPGATDTTTYTGVYTLTQSDLNAGRVTNLATATGYNPGGDPVSDDDTVTTHLSTDASLVLTKTATLNDGGDGRADVGDTVIYGFTVRNAGNVTLTAVTVTDTLAGLTLSGGPIASLAPGATDATTYTGVYTLTQSDLDAGRVVNLATATGRDPGGVGVSDDDTVTTPLPSVSSLILTKTATLNDGGDGRADVGDTVIYGFAVQNTGNVTLTDVTVTDTLAGLALSGGPIASLAPGVTDMTTYTGVYTLTQTDLDAGRVVNLATASGLTPGGDPVSDDDTVTTPVTAAGGLVLTKTATLNDGGDGRADAGDTVTYGFAVQNTGNVTLSNVTVTDTLAGLTLSGGPIASLAPGATDTTTYTGVYTLTQADLDARQVINLATAMGRDPAGDPVSDDDTVTTPLAAQPALVAVKTAALTTDERTQGVGNSGDVITYAVVVTNMGNVTLENLVVEDVFQSDPATLLTCAPTLLAPGEAATCVSYTHTITVDEANTAQLLNNTVTARANALGDVAVVVTATSAAVVAVEADPADLRVTKTATPREVNIGDLVRYVVVIENIGVVDAVDATLIDTPPAGFTLVEGSLSVVDADGAFRLAGVHPVRVDQIDIAVGDKATVTYLLRVGAGVRPGVHVNHAQAQDGDAVSNVATAEVRLVSDPMLDESLIVGTVFDDRDGDGWQDRADLTRVRIRGGFAEGAYVAGSTTMDRGDGAMPVADASAPMLHGIDVGAIAARQSDADTARTVVISQTLSRLDFTDDLVLTTGEGFTVRMDAAGVSRVEKTGDAARGLSGAEPTVERRVTQTTTGYRVDYVITNAGVDERGIPGVRIASVEGLIMETDQFGRYHLEGVEGGPWERGRNFILKIDRVTLPPGAVFTTDNPLVRRITPGLPVRFDFGVRMPQGVITAPARTVEMDLGEVVFAPGAAAIQPVYAPVLDRMAAEVRANGAGEVIITADGETQALAFDRARSLQTALLERLSPEQGRALQISLRTLPSDPATTLVTLGETTILGEVLFDTDQAAIRPEFAPLIERIAARIDSMGGGVVAVTGHADRRGSADYNAALALRRAQAVQAAIAARLSPTARERLRVEIHDRASAIADDNTSSPQ